MYTPLQKAMLQVWNQVTCALNRFQTSHKSSSTRPCPDDFKVVGVAAHINEVWVYIAVTYQNSLYKFFTWRRSRTLLSCEFRAIFTLQV